LKNKELLINQRKEIADNIKELMDFMWNNSDDNCDRLLENAMVMLRCIDWSLDDSDLGFEEYCLKSNTSISEEFGIIM
jgi:chromosome condensin MukBEF complex kleisin-like MukF subunit